MDTRANRMLVNLTIPMAIGSLGGPLRAPPCVGHRDVKVRLDTRLHSHGLGTWLSGSPSMAAGFMQ